MNLKIPPLAAQRWFTADKKAWLVLHLINEQGEGDANIQIYLTLTTVPNYTKTEGSSLL